MRYLVDANGPAQAPTALRSQLQHNLTVRPYSHGAWRRSLLCSPEHSQIFECLHKAGNEYIDYVKGCIIANNPNLEEEIEEL
jgi:hypothetical protein